MKQSYHPSFLEDPYLLKLFRSVIYFSRLFHFRVNLLFSLWAAQSLEFLIKPSLHDEDGARDGIGREEEESHFWKLWMNEGLGCRREVDSRQVQDEKAEKRGRRVKKESKRRRLPPSQAKENPSKLSYHGSSSVWSRQNLSRTRMQGVVICKGEGRLSFEDFHSFRYIFETSA